MEIQNTAMIFMVFLSFGQLALSLSTTQAATTLPTTKSTKPTTQTSTSSAATNSTTVSTTDSKTTKTTTAATTTITTITATASTATTRVDTTDADTTNTDVTATTSADYANNGDDFNVPRLDQDSTDVAAFTDNTTDTTLSAGDLNTTMQATETSTDPTKVSSISSSTTPQTLTTTSKPTAQATSTMTSPPTSSTSSVTTLITTNTKQPTTQPTTQPPPTITTTVSASKGTTTSTTKPTAVPTTTRSPLTTTWSKVTTTDVKSTTTPAQSDKANNKENNADCEKRMFSETGLVAFIVVLCLCFLLMFILLGLIMFFTRRRSRKQLHDDDSTPRLKMLEIREMGGAGSSSIKPGSSTDDGLQTYSLDYEGQEKDYEKHVRDKIEEHKRKTQKQSEEPGSTFLLGKKASIMSSSTTKDRSNPSSPTSPRENTSLKSEDGDNDSQVFNFSRKPGESLVARRASNFENNDRRRSAASTGKGGKVMLTKGDDYNVDKFDDV